MKAARIFCVFAAAGSAAGAVAIAVIGGTAQGITFCAACAALNALTAWWIQ